MIARHSTTPGAVPATSALQDAELAFNIRDGILYARANDGTTPRIETFLPKSPIAAVAASGQTAITFTGIPAWASRIMVSFAGLSTSGNSQVIIRPGVSGGPVTSGYLGTAMDNSSGANVAVMSTGFLTQALTANTSAAAVRHGGFLLTTLGSNIWSFFGIANRSDAAVNHQGAGSVPLGGTLTSVTITTAGGTDTFDAGSVGLMWG